VRLGGVVLLESHAATAHLFDHGAYIADLKHGLQELT